MAIKDPPPDSSFAGDGLPSHIDEQDVREAVEQADVLLDVQDALRLSRKRTLTILSERGLDGEVRQPDDAMLADLRDRMGIKP